MRDPTALRLLEGRARAHQLPPPRSVARTPAVQLEAHRGLRPVSARSSPGGAPSPAVPSRKISETIIDFGAPLIFDLDKNQPIEIVRSVFTIVITVWNAHVMAMPVWGKPQLLEQLGELLRALGTAPEMLDTCAELTARRQLHFADNPRAVGEWKIEFDHAGRVRLHCDARIPPSLTPPQL